MTATMKPRQTHVFKRLAKVNKKRDFDSNKELTIKLIHSRHRSVHYHLESNWH